MLIVGLGATGIGTFRLMLHFADADFFDVILLAVGFILNLIVAINASFLALGPSDTGVLSSYSGLAEFTLVFFGIALFSVLMCIVAIIRGFLQTKELKLPGLDE